MILYGNSIAPGHVPCKIPAGDSEQFRRTLCIGHQSDLLAFKRQLTSLASIRILRYRDQNDVATKMCRHDKSDPLVLLVGILHL